VKNVRWRGWDQRLCNCGGAGGRRHRDQGRPGGLAI